MRSASAARPSKAPTAYSGTPISEAVEDMQHRDTDVLMLYPLDLVAVEERYGSWMTQYGYTNYVTAAKLLERGKVSGNAIEMAGRRFTTLVTLFEPFPSKKLLAMMQEFTANGGRLIWSGPPPIVTLEGDSARETWQNLFNVDYQPRPGDGIISSRQAGGLRRSAWRKSIRRSF